MHTNASASEQKWFELLFAVKRSARYHCRRRHFFDLWGLWLALLTILFGGVAAFNAKTPAAIFRVGGGLVALLSVTNVVVGFVKRGREHWDLERQYISLEKDMVGAGSSPTEPDLIKFSQRRLEIEAGEPPKKCALDVLCHNEIANSLGCDPSERVKMKLHHRLLAHFFSFDGDCMRKISDCTPKAVSSESA